MERIKKTAVSLLMVILLKNRNDKVCDKRLLRWGEEVVAVAESASSFFPLSGEWPSATQKLPSPKCRRGKA